MPSLFGREVNASDTRLARGVSGGISVAAQLALGVAVVLVSNGVTPPAIVKSPLFRPQSVTAVFLPTPVIETPFEPAPAPTAPEEVKILEAAPDRSALVAVRTFENKAVPTPGATEVRPADVEARPEPPSPALPPPTPAVGAFPNAATTARATELAKRVEAAGFDTPTAHARQSSLGVAAVGAFDAAPSQGTRRMGASTERSTAVMESGFNQNSPAAQPTQQSRVIRDSGFGMSDNHERPKAPDRAVLQQTGFSDARMTESIRRSQAAPPKAPALVAVQVLSKPTPIYTDEARRLKIEGEVVLEVEFCASGVVRVVRVVRGLGYGLDESATVAAQSIQFKPATSEGRVVDYRTTVQIVFRLA